MTLIIVGTEGPACARMTIADYAARAAQPIDLPEFTFSPKVTRVTEAKPKPAQPKLHGLHILSTNNERSPWPRPSVRAKNTPGKADPIWDTAIEPKFKSAIPQPELRPMGTAPTLEGLGHFLARDAEIRAIASTQKQELPTIVQELALNGIASSSFSHGADDDSEAGNFLESSTLTPYKFANMDPEETALLRRIEWEKYIFACGGSVRIAIEQKPDGGRTLRANDARWKPADLVPFIEKMKQLMGERTIEELVNDRARVRHYGRPVELALMDEGKLNTWKKRGFTVTEYLNTGDDNTTRIPFEAESPEWDDDESDGAPVELGFDDPDSPFEPTEFDLWELTKAERRNGIVPLERAILIADLLWSQRYSKTA